MKFNNVYIENEIENSFNTIEILKELSIKKL